MIKVTLRDCCALNQYQQLDANTLSQLRTKCGNVKLLPSSKDYDWVSTKELASNFICNGEIITLGKARYANIKYCKGDFVSANNVIIESNAPSKILTKYLFYYCLKKNKNFYIEGTTYPKFDLNSFNKCLIPLYSIEEQTHIVSTCDTIQHQVDLLNKQLTLLDEFIKSRFVGWEASICC